MNGQSMCREELEQGRKCGLHYGHQGPHACCDLHKPRTTPPPWEQS